GAGADVEVLVSERMIGHAMLVFHEVVGDGEQTFAPALVTGASLWNRGVRRGERIEHLCDVPSTEAALLFVDPLTQGSATLWMQTAASLPERLGDVVPVDAGHSFGKVLLIAVPDVVRAVCEKE